MTPSRNAKPRSEALTIFEDPRYYIPCHEGEAYRQVLGRLHRTLQPKNYLEIGIRRGASLRRSRVTSVGVDPEPLVPDGFSEANPHIHIVRMTSDDFFAGCDVPALLGGAVDFAFLDGLHHAEALLKDFLNTERLADRNSVIVLHDCIPTDVGMTRRAQRETSEYSRHNGQWAGDVWKIIPILQSYRPDLRIAFLDAPPTGLVLVTNLDPDSTTLADRYDELKAEMKELDLAAMGLAEYVSALGVRPTTSLKRRGDI